MGCFLDTSAYYHDAESYMHAVFIEVCFFLTGKHTLLFEALGINGSGSRNGVLIAYFGLRPNISMLFTKRRGIL